MDPDSLQGGDRRAVRAGEEEEPDSLQGGDRRAEEEPDSLQGGDRRAGEEEDEIWSAGVYFPRKSGRGGLGESGPSRAAPLGLRK